MRERGDLMEKKIDARDLPCPQPVVLTKKALEDMDEGVVEVTVDNEPASENVSRLAQNSNCKVEVKREQNNFRIIIKKGKDDIQKTSKQKKTISVFVTSDTIGKGDDTLGKILIRAFFPTLLEIEPKPSKLIFMNAGVKLTVEDSEVLGSLEELQKNGFEILVCGTCLDFFNIKNRIKVGRISNMFEIMNTLMNSDRIISI